MEMVIMALEDDIADLRNMILADLDAVHDYYSDTKNAWRIVQLDIQHGRKFVFHNVQTGNVTTEDQIFAKAQRYTNEYLAISTFQQFVSLFEDFTIGVIRWWLLAFPQSLSRKELPMSVVLNAVDLDAVMLVAVNLELNELSFKRVREWFSYLEHRVKLGCPTSDEIDRLAEIKATRDIFVHNRGVASSLYEEKSGLRRRTIAGERLEMTEQYHRESWELIRKVVRDVSDAAIAKAKA
jgi:hypothetical protein